MAHASENALKKNSEVSQKHDQRYNQYGRRPIFGASRVPKEVDRYIMTEKQLQINGYPRPSRTKGKCNFYKWDESVVTPSQWSPRKTCRFCEKEFVLYKNGDFEVEEECLHHWGNKMKLYRRGSTRVYSCCKQGLSSKGCTLGRTHVHQSNRNDCDGYVQTTKKEGEKKNDEIFAVDCEMSYTVDGYELVRVSVVDMDCNVVMNQFVRPNSRVLNYNTKWSGVTEEDLIGVTRTLSDVQQEFLDKFSADTIFLGHSLESDLKVLRIIHSSVIDTSVLFPSNKPYPFKYGLSRLVSDKLGIKIQDPSATGHDSNEDAKACVKLLKWKMRMNGIKV